MSARSPTIIATAIALSIPLTFPASAQKRGFFYVRCPLQNVTPKITDPIAAPWFQVIQPVGLLSTTKIWVVNGEKKLMCFYWDDQTPLPTMSLIMRKFPRASSCVPISRGFRCVT